MQQQTYPSAHLNPLNKKIEEFLEPSIIEALIKTVCFKDDIPLGMSLNPKKVDLRNSNASSVILFTERQDILKVKEMLMEEVERQTFVLLHKDVKRLNMTKLMRHFYLHRMFLSLEHSGERFASQVIVVDVTFEQFVNQNFESLTFLENKNTLMKKRKNKVSKINLLNPEPTA